MSSLPPSAQRRRRIDGQQNAATILDAAGKVLAVRPDAGLTEVAKAAGVSRQTVYAHFPSREALIDALIAQATVRVVTALEAADLDRGPADQALVRLLEIGWEALAMDPFLLQLTTREQTPEQDRERHAPILGHVHAVVERGQREGDIDPELPISWVLASIFAIGHAAGEEVRAGRMTSATAIDVLRRTIPRLIRPHD
ncbi:TetR/AcrR family transcriptional regulator [Nocardia sp. NPDC020380]|uniref:TetR/AcrR family transcriptional regulator n=1 Tax=Nocardia sp. NPDC020380 TaxID=3364309 RepID=UPI00379580A8